MDFSLEQANERLFSRIDKFSPMTLREKEMIFPFLEIKSLKKAQYFVREGRRALDVGFVLRGSLRQFYTKDGDEKTTYFFFDDHFISAYISCLTGLPSLITIEALSTVEYISFPYAALCSLFEKSMGWQRFGRLVAEYLFMGMEERMAGLLLQSPEERYLDLLAGGKRKILERIPQHYIANYLGITPVSMSRIRNRVLRNGKDSL